jgi:hypothetical protein
MMTPDQVMVRVLFLSYQFGFTSFSLFQFAIYSSSLGTIMHKVNFYYVAS